VSTEAERARKLAWYKANRDKELARHRAWYEANRDRELARHRAYRDANREMIQAKDRVRMRDWRAAHPRPLQPRKVPDRSGCRSTECRKGHGPDVYRRSDGVRRGCCTTCRQEHQQAAYRRCPPQRRDPEKFRARQRAWRQANPDRMRAKHQREAERHPRVRLMDGTRVRVSTLPSEAQEVALLLKQARQAIRNAKSGGAPI
jgi:hypothetical protein